MKLMDSEIQDILNPKKDKANLISLRQYWLYRYILQNTKLDPEKEYIFLFHILYRYNIFTVVLFYDDGKFRSIASYFNSNIHGHKPGTRLIY